MKTSLKYKGIEFDFFRKDGYGVFTSMCKSCQSKYKELISSDYETQGEGGGNCGVRGCNNSDWDGGTIVNYLDLDINEVN